MQLRISCRPVGAGIRCLAALAVLAWTAAIVPAFAQADAAVSTDIGRKAYTSYCARCHGVNLVMVTGTFDLRRFPKDDKERFVRVVTTGQRAMPAWGGIVKPEEIDAIWAYVGAVNGWGAAAAAATK